MFVDCEVLFFLNKMLVIIAGVLCSVGACWGFVVVVGGEWGVGSLGW